MRSKQLALKAEAQLKSDELKTRLAIDRSQAVGEDHVIPRLGGSILVIPRGDITMGFTGKQLAGEVGGKLMLLIIFWGLTGLVTACFSPSIIGGMKEFLLTASENGNSIIPVLAAATTVALLYITAIFQKSPRRFQHAAEYVADIADNLGSTLFLLGWSVSIVFFACPSVERAVLSVFGILVGFALVVFSKKFGA
ncbi:hypothetical protein ABQ039_000605 [Xanthomonas sp. WHRI 6108]|uniref:hypothetical protein n=1 Tax=Xanthomonas TaxID=338 RepID=UPI0016216EF5|nr:hypothetical protein [Xanthomonas arboricola]MBB5674284.1 hypothetical protein [Xanthomonas arboricola]